MKTNAPKTKKCPNAGVKSDNTRVIRKIRISETKRFDELLGRYHYLGEGRPAGDTMRMVAEIQGEWVGLLERFRINISIHYASVTVSGLYFQ